MSFRNNITGWFSGGAMSAPTSGPDANRAAEWESALQQQRLPSFVATRLAAASAGKVPWVATMSAAELGLARSKGIRPLAMVSGTCWFHYGWSWTEGHGAGWRQALARLKQEAAAAGANAVVDVKMRKVRLAAAHSMDFTLLGTAVRINALPAGTDPVVATVPALEFVRLIEADIVPVGIAIGAQYQYLQNNQYLQNFGFSLSGGTMYGAGLGWIGGNLWELGQFWEGVRRSALAELHRDTQRQGNGVLAHTHFGELLRIEGDENNPPYFLARHIVIGTVVDTNRLATVPHAIRAVVDMRDDLSPLSSAAPTSHNAYPVRDDEGAI